MSEEPIQFGGASHRLRGWLVLLVREASRVAIVPFGQSRFHLLLFYAAVLAPVYGQDEPVPKIIKLRDRPFYPEAQKELVRLVVHGFVANRTRWSISDDGWESDDYSSTKAGLEIARLLERSQWGHATASFVRDLVAGFIELNVDDADGIILEDALFRNSALARGDIRDLRERNEVAETARRVADYEEDGLRPGPRDSIALYFEFLQARRAA